MVELAAASNEKGDDMPPNEHTSPDSWIEIQSDPQQSIAPVKVSFKDKFTDKLKQVVNKLDRSNPSKSNTHNLQIPSASPTDSPSEQTQQLARPDIVERKSEKNKIESAFNRN